MLPPITLYGAARCHKTQHYLRFLRERGLAHTFRDVEEDVQAAMDLRALYANGKLNFPTITIGTKRLRNPSDRDLEKWLTRLVDHK